MKKLRSVFSASVSLGLLLLAALTLLFAAQPRVVLSAQAAAPAAGMPQAARVENAAGAQTGADALPITWHTEFLPGAAGAVDLALDTQGFPHLAYEALAANFDYELAYARRTPGGWETETVAGMDAGGQLALALDGQDRAQISFSACNAAACPARFAAWDGSAWQVEPQTPWNGALALDSQGRAHIAAILNNGVTNGLGYQRWNGAAWVTQTLQLSAGEYDYPSIALDGAGRAHIGYYYNDRLQYTYWNGVQWLSPVVDAASGRGQFEALALDSGGQAHFAYYDAANQAILYAAPSLSAWDIQVVAQPVEMAYGRISLALDGSDRPMIAFEDEGLFQVFLARPDAGGWLVEMVDYGTLPSLQIDAFGRPHLAYTGGGLVYAWGEFQGPAVDPLSLSLTPGVAASLVYTDAFGLETQLLFPAAAVLTTTQVVFTPTLAQDVLGFAFGGQSFELQAYRDGQRLDGFNFAAPVEGLIDYGEAQAAVVTDENQLALLHTQMGAWSDAIDGCSPPGEYLRNPSLNRIQVTFCDTGRFALYGPTESLSLPAAMRSLPAIELPAVESQAQPSNLDTYDVGLQVSNLSAEAAHLRLNFTAPDGSQSLSVDDNLIANSSNTYFPLNDIGGLGNSLPPGYFGSALISADRPLAAIANTLGSDQSGDFLAFGASYGGQDEGATTVNLPLLMRENFGYSTWFSVHNLGFQATDIQVTYSSGLVQTVASVETKSLAPGAALVFDQRRQGGLPVGFVGSAVVRSLDDQPLAVSVFEVGPATLFAYDGSIPATTQPVFPLVNENNFGFVTGVQIQNTGLVTSTVTVRYLPSAGWPGTACQEVRRIGPQRSTNFGLHVFTDASDGDPDSLVSTDCVMGETFVGSAQVTANSAGVPLAGIVNQLNVATNKGAAYKSFAKSNSSATVVFPLVMDRNYGYFTGMTLTNLGSNLSAGQIVCTVRGTSINGTVVKQFNSPAVPSGGSWTLVNHPDQSGAIAERFVGSATCVAPAGSLLAGTLNELNDTSEKDAFLVYEGINVP